MNDFLSSIKVFNTSWIYIIILVVISVFTSVITKGVQFRHFHNCFKSVNLAHSGKLEKKQISSFYSIFTTIAGRAGTGNIIGIALAIFEGGPGVILWLWLFSLFSMATSFCEATLAQIYKESDKTEEGVFRGGTAYYTLKGLGKNMKWLAIVFAVAVIIAKGVFILSLNVNTISAVMQRTFFPSAATSSSTATIIQWVVVAILVVLIGLVLLGGIHRMIKVSSLLSPVFIVVYLGITLAAFVTHGSLILPFFGSIFKNAFTPLSFFGAAGGAGVGYLIKFGAQRSFFSNESGEGTTTHAAATTSVDHPVKQGFGQAFSVFIDSIILCTLSGFLFSLALFNWHSQGKDMSHFNQMFAQGHSVANWQWFGTNNIAIYSVMAIVALLGKVGSIFFAVTLFFFAFGSTLVGILIAEFNVYWLYKQISKKINYETEKKVIWGYRGFILVIVAISPFLIASSLFTLADFITAICFILSGIVIISCSRIVKKALLDFDRQYKIIKKVDKPYIFDPVKLNIQNAKLWLKINKTL